MISCVVVVTVVIAHATNTYHDRPRRASEVLPLPADRVALRCGLRCSLSATTAVEATRAIRTELADDDLQVRIGIRVGEIYLATTCRASPSTSPPA